MCKLANIKEKKINPERDRNYNNFMARSVKMGIELREAMIDKLRIKNIELDYENQQLKKILEQKKGRITQLVGNIEIDKKGNDIKHLSRPAKENNSRN